MPNTPRNDMEGQVSTNLGRVALCPRGPYTAGQIYDRLDLVGYDGSGWICLKDGTKSVPEEGSEWTLYVERGAPGQKGKDGTVSFDELTPEQKESLRGDPGPEGPPGNPGQPGKDATINGENVLKIVEGDNVTIEQQKNTLIISATGSGRLPEGGAPGQVLTKTEAGAEWDDAPKELPDGGTPGQVLTKVQDGVAWATPSGGGASNNTNILDNALFIGGGSQQGGGQFPINYRGQTEYTDTGYTIDRWVLAGDSLKIELDGIVISNGEATNRGIEQRVEKSQLRPGEVYTISVLVSELNGTAKTTFWGKHYEDIHVGVTSLTFTYTGEEREVSAYPVVHLHGTVKVVAAKLELGPVQTLAHQDEDGNWVLNDPPPNYALESIKCQNQQVIIGSTSLYTPVGLAVARSATSASLHIPIPTMLRARPSISVIGSVCIRNASVEIPTSNVSIDMLAPASVVAFAKSSGFTVNSTYEAILYPNNFIVIDANP